MTSDDFADDLDEREEPDTDDADWNLEPALIRCPYCGGGISEDAELCPHCRSYISKEDAPVQKKSPWLIVGIGLLVLLLALGWMWRH